MHQQGLLKGRVGRQEVVDEEGRRPACHGPALRRALGEGAVARHQARPRITQYFPDTYPAGKGPPRQYFFDILNTLQPEYLERILKHANEQRMSANAAD